MAKVERASSVSGDLERELMCSICTDVLFQPLTLLDCLHTFCGACLKEWFAFQASTATSIHPYTCPACRASVRSTQPNATVTTLLEIFLKANPARGKSDSDKQADRGRYKPGDNVLPKLRRRDGRDEADRRMVEERQPLSMSELDIASSQSGHSSTLELPRLADGDVNGSRDSRRSRGRQRSRSGDPHNVAPMPSPSRAVEHQASLRSLLSASELETDEMDESLVRKVLEELVSEGVDLSQIGLAQEEEITERIAEAVRRRQADRQRERGQRERRERLARDGRASPRSSSFSPSIRSSSQSQGQADGGVSTPQHLSGPSLSRSAVINAASRGSRTHHHHHQRSSSHGSSQPSLRPSTTPSHDDAGRPPPQRRQSDSNHLLRPVLPVLVRTEPCLSCRRCNKANIEYELHYYCARCSDGDGDGDDGDTKYNICLACYRLAKGCKHWFGFGYAAGLNYERKAPVEGYSPGYDLPHTLIAHRYRRPSQALHASQPAERLEAGVFCDVCKAFANTCYWKCDYCNEGDWGYCNACVIQGRHCTHPLLPLAQKEEEKAVSSRHDAQASPHSTSPADTAPSTPPPPLTLHSASPIRGLACVTVAGSAFRLLHFTTLCNMCRYPISPSHTRYHCSQCNGGDYDVCMACYHKANISGRIAKEDGANGWRKCLRGHRMTIVGFEDCAGRQRRVVLRDLVGGYALKEEQTHVGARPTGQDSDGSGYHSRASSAVPLSGHRYPPDGGGGLRLLATWGFWPEEGVKDELAFPRCAEIREAEDLNGEWYWGVYCGAKGLFPANHVKTV